MFAPKTRLCPERNIESGAGVNSRRIKGSRLWPERHVESRVDVNCCRLTSVSCRSPAHSLILRAGAGNLNQKISARQKTVLGRGDAMANRAPRALVLTGSGNERI